MKCPLCGQEAEANEKYCKKCGAALIAAPNVPEQKAAPAGSGMLSKGCKIWFWFLLIVDCLAVIGYLLSIVKSPLSSILGIIGAVLTLGGAALILFKQQKLGFYLICASAVLGLIGTLVTADKIGAGTIIGGVIGALISPLISWYFVNKNKDVLQ